MTETIVCAGDSITRGNIGVDYVAMVRRLVGPGRRVQGAGVNSDLAYNLRQRLDRVVRARPGVVTVLIGTNDARASISERAAKRLARKKNLPVPPTMEWFAENLDGIVTTLRAETDAKIGLLSLPVLGQGLDAPGMTAAANFSRVIKDIAGSHGVGYLPLFERQVAYLSADTATSRLEFRDDMNLVYSAILQRLVLRRSFDDIARRRGLALTTDFIHQNSRGATMIADLVTEFA